MTSQGDGGHHFALSHSDLVTQIDERGAFFRPDTDDPVFFDIISINCLSVFSITFHFVKIALNVHQGCEELL